MPGAQPQDRRRCKLEFIDEFWSAAEELVGLAENRAKRQARAASAVREFFNAWTKKTAASDHELKQGRWKYKTLQGRKAKAAKLRQIYVTNEHGGLRAALVVEEGQDCVMRAVLAYHKRNQDAEIDRAAAIAQELRRERQ